MRGNVDAAGRALLKVELKPEGRNDIFIINAWIDTRFTGDLVLTSEQIEKLALPVSGTVSAVLANGQEVAMETFACSIRWFEHWQHLEVVESIGEHALLGVGMLLDRELRIDYRNSDLTVD